MSEEIMEKRPSNVVKSVISSIASSFNINIENRGDSMNNTTQNINNFNFTRQPQKAKPRKAIIQKVYKEVLSNDQTIIKLIWNFLSIEDKFNCTLVCKRFNYIISGMDCFHLLIHFPSDLHFIPTLSRNYKIVIFQLYECNNLKPLMHKMLKHLGQSVTDLRFYKCQFNLITLCKFLCEFPLLESLELDMILTVKKIVELSVEDKPKLLQLKDFKIKVNDKFNETLDMTCSTSNIQSLSLFDTIFEIDKISNMLKRNKRSLNYISLTKCNIKENKMSHLNTLHLDVRNKLPPNDYRCFDSLDQLRVLHMSEVNSEMFKILDTKCIKWLSNLEIIYKSQQKKKMSDFFINYIFKFSDKRFVHISSSEFGFNLKTSSNHQLKNHIKFNRKSTDENVINTCFEFKHIVSCEPFLPCASRTINIQWNNIDNELISKHFLIEMKNIIHILAEKEKKLAEKWIYYLGRDE